MDCTACSVGSTSAVGSTSVGDCTVCPIGSYINSSGSCVVCPLGTIDPLDGLTSCTSCPANTYNSNNITSSLAICVDCSVGSTSPVGSTSASDCTVCPSGSYVNGSGTCVVCPAGTYGLSASSTSCSSCPADTYNSNTGSTSASACIGCPTGYTSQAGSSALSDCTDCPAGKCISLFDIFKTILVVTHNRKLC